MPPRIKSVMKYVDAASMLAGLTAVLYFWGYVYYNAFCEYLGFRFRGISVSIQDYLVGGWRSVILAIIIVLVLLFLSELTWAGVNWLVDRKARKNAPIKTPLHKSYRRSLGYYRIVVVILPLMCLYLSGAKNVILDAERDAEAVKGERRSVTIRDLSNVEIKGQFALIRDFGGALAVYELTSDRKTAIGIRIIKQSGYQSYTIGPSEKIANKAVEVTPTAVPAAANAPAEPSAGAPHH